MRALVLGLAVGLLAPGCSVNPLTGRRELALIGEAEEVALGARLDREIVETVGAYPDPALAARVGRLGARIAAASERPDLRWTFRVLEEPGVNAFALPGGFVYVTRGLLAHLVSEAQLAAVLGHEVGHVSARHSVNQISRAAVASTGAGLFRIFDPAGRHVAAAAARGIERFILRHSREDEIEADDLGVRYLGRVEQDPHAMLGVLQTVEAAAQASGAERVPDHLSTHPDPALRRARLERTLGPAPAAPVDPAFLHALDGLVVGENPLDGFVVGERWVHPILGLRLQLPPGWACFRDKTSVAALSPGGEALILLTLSAADTPVAAHAAFFAATGLSPGEPWRDRIAAWAVVSSWFALAGEAGEFVGIAAFVGDARRVFELYALVAVRRAADLGPAAEVSLASLAPLGPDELEVEPMRIRIRSLEHAASLAELAAARPASVDVATLARLNQVQADKQLPASTLVKWVEGGVVTGKAR